MEFRKNGFNDSDAATLAKTATMFQNVSDEAISAGDSASFIISQMIAFGIEAENAQSIIDKVNETANKFSVSSGDLSKALGIVASTSSAMGNSIDQTLGVVTAITEQTRNASKSARAANTIFSRLAQVVDENSDTGKKLTEIYNNLGIALYDSSGQMRSTYDILADLASKWDSLDKNTQQYIAITSAGTNQLNNFLALMNNFDHAAEATATSINSAGSAMRENEAYQESLEYQTNNLKATFQDLANNVIDKELISSVLKLSNAFLELANTGLGQFITKTTLLGGTAWGLSSLVKVTKIIPVITSQFKNVAEMISLAAGGAGTLGEAFVAVGGFAGTALPILLAVSAALVGIFELADYIENKDVRKLEDLSSALQDTNDKIAEMSGAGSEYDTLINNADKLTEKEQERLGVLQAQLDTLKEQAAEQEAAYLKEWQSQQTDQKTETTHKLVTGSADEVPEGAQKLYGQYWDVATTTEYTESQRAAENLRTAINNLNSEKRLGVTVGSEYISKLQGIIDEYQETYDTTIKVRDAGYELDDSQEYLVKVMEHQKEVISDLGAEYAQNSEDIGQFANSLDESASKLDAYIAALDEYRGANEDASSASETLVNSLFDANGQLTEAAQQALTADGAMASMAQSFIQSQMQAAQADYSTLILAIQEVGNAAMITSAQLANMMAMAGVGGSTSDMKRTYQIKYGKSAEADTEAYNKWLSSTLADAADAKYRYRMQELQNQLKQVSGYVPSSGGGSSKKSAEEKAAEEAEKQAKKAQKAQEKAAKQSQQAYESAAKSAEQAAQEAARAAEQAAEEAKQKILDSIQELKDASDDFWDSKTDAIEETNKELDRQKQLEEKLKALEEAKQRKILLYKNGQFQYDKDYGTIAKAQADYEETRDKIQHERELEQLEEMKDNATEIFNEMKDIVQNGGDVTQSMINNWLKNMAASGADYYDSNKKLLGEWLDWAQGAIKEFSQSALESIGSGYRSTSGTYRSNAAAGGGLLESILDYQQNPKYWRNGEFIGMGAAMWTDLFEAQLANGYFGDYTTMPESIGKLPGSSVFDDWQKAFEYWARDSMQSVDALEDMIDRLVAAKGVLDRHKDEFKSLGRDDLYQKALDVQDIDEDKLFRYAKLYGAVQNPDMPFGFSPYLREDEFKNLDPDQKLAALLPMIRDYEYWTGSRTAEGEHQEWFQGRSGSKDYTLGKDYGRLTYTGDIVRTAKTYTDEGKKIYMFTDAGGDYYVDRKKTYFDQKKLAQWYEENERAISEIQEKLWEIPGDELLQKALEQELERRRQARVYSADVLGYDTEAAEAQSEYERERQSRVGYVEAKRQRKTDENLFKIQDALARLDRGNQVSDKYLSNASDYIGKVIEENAQKILDANSDAEKKALEAQNAQLELMRQQVEEGKTGQRTENVYEWEDAEFEDYDPTEDVARMLRELQQAMQENSKAWWDADEETRKQLHESNIRLAKQIEDLSNTRMTYEGHTGVWTQTARNATGTHNFRGGLSIVGENGPELRVLRRGDNIIPADKTANLWKWASLTPNSMLAAIGNRSSKAGNVSYGFNISNLQLPNVTDAKSLVQGLKNYALQYSYKR